MSKPDWENFAKAILADWPTGDLEGSVLFDLALQYGMIREVPGGYNSDHHFADDGICPEEGDPWYEYTFRGEAGPGLYSISDMDNRIKDLEAKLAKAVDMLMFYGGVMPNAFSPIQDGGEKARTTLAELKGEK